MKPVHLLTCTSMIRLVSDKIVALSGGYVIMTVKKYATVFMMDGDSYRGRKLETIAVKVGGTSSLLKGN